MALNNWYFIGVTYSSALTPVAHIFKGTPALSIAEATTYSLTTDGSGTTNSDSASGMILGNSFSVGAAVGARMGMVGIWNRVLTLAEMEEQRVRPRATNGCVLLTYLGEPGTATQRDYSGYNNHGTVTGATFVDGPPLPTFSRRRLYRVRENGPPTGIQFDATSNSGYKSASSSYTWNHTCTGSNRELIVSISVVGSSGISVSSITYNSVAMTRLSSSSSGVVSVEMWGLTAPATGTNTISVTLSGACDSVGCACSFTGVNQTVSTEGANTGPGSGGAGTASVDVTTVADNDWVVASISTSDTTITSDQTERQNVSGAFGTGAMETFGPQTPAGLKTMTWSNIGAIPDRATVGVALRPVAAPSSTWMFNPGWVRGSANLIAGGWN